MPVDLVASYVKKENRDITVGITNNGGQSASTFTVELYAQCKAPEAIKLQQPPQMLVASWNVAQLTGKGSFEKIVSIDDIIAVVSKDSRNLPGIYDLEVRVDSKFAVQESSEGNNIKTVNGIVIARAPVPEKAYDYTKVYNASNQSELIKMALDGPSSLW